MADDDDELDLLLARGRLSSPQRDRMFEQIVAGMPAPRRNWRRLAPMMMAAAGFAIIVGLFAGRDGFRARGTGGAVLEIGCRSAAGERCPSGEVLLFRVSGVDRPAWLAAYAEPSGGGERVWYFPTAAGASPAIDAGAAPRVLPEGARLGPEQPPGRYRVKLLLFASPPTRAMVLGDTPLASGARTLEVTR
jgi:hypothetical protein